MLCPRTKTEASWYETQARPGNTPCLCSLRVAGESAGGVELCCNRLLYPLAPVMCERIKRRTVCNESGNSGPQRERDVNYSCKTWTNLPAELFHGMALL